MNLRAKQSNQQPNQLRVRATGLLVIAIALIVGVGMQAQAMAQQAVEFAGTVLSVDVGTKKFAVLKEGGGTRFTFVVTDQTQFKGEGLKGLSDLKKGDAVTVTYRVVGSQYLTQDVTKKTK
jgi:Cu/Ag efflux protein CusF